MTCKVTGSTSDIKPQLFFSFGTLGTTGTTGTKSLPRFQPFKTFQPFHLIRSLHACLLDDDVSIIVDCSLLLRMNHGRCIQLLDDRRSGNLMTWFQTVPRVYLAIEHTMLLTEID